jgi:hypothetical protein
MSAGGAGLPAGPGRAAEQAPAAGRATAPPVSRTAFRAGSARRSGGRTTDRRIYISKTTGGAATGTHALAPAEESSRSPILERLAEIPEEAVWLASWKSVRYRTNVHAFMRLMGRSSSDQLRATTHREIVFRENHMRETEGLENSTVRRRLAALSSLFRHLVRHRHMEKNPAAEVRRPSVNRR